MISFDWLDLVGWEWVGLVVMGAVGLWAVVGREVGLVISLFALILILTRVG